MKYAKRNFREIEELHQRLNKIDHRVAGLFDSPTVNRVYDIIMEKKVEFWTDIALYANKCGLQGEEYMRFCEYGASLLGLHILEEEYKRIKDVTQTL